MSLSSYTEQPVKFRDSSPNKLRDLTCAQMLVDAGAGLGRKVINGLIPAQMLLIEKLHLLELHERTQ